ncbi:kelch-like protein, partial [Corallococcus exiguus]
SLATAEVYDPTSNTWTATGSLAAARYNHTATLLPSGKVLVVGGRNSSGLLATAEEYDPGTGQWSATGALGTARELHSATLLSTGKVLVTGGMYGSAATAALASSEVYDPATRQWSAAGPMAGARYSHVAV